jgi:hypothetical protein
MAQFRAFSPNVEVCGQAVLSVIKGMGSFTQSAKEILARHGLKAVEETVWYPQQGWLDSFQEISKSVGPRTVNQIGLTIPDSAKLPPGIDSVDKALASIDVCYHLNHRGGEIGHYIYKKTGEKMAEIECLSPFPCDFDEGVIKAFAKRFATPGVIPKVKHDTAKPCKSKQGESCTFLISW